MHGSDSWRAVTAKSVTGIALDLDRRSRRSRPAAASRAARSRSSGRRGRAQRLKRLGVVAERSKSRDRASARPPSSQAAAAAPPTPEPGDARLSVFAGQPHEQREPLAGGGVRINSSYWLVFKTCCSQVVAGGFSVNVEPSSASGSGVGGQRAHAPHTQEHAETSDFERDDADDDDDRSSTTSVSPSSSTSTSSLENAQNWLPPPPPSSSSSSSAVHMRRRRDSDSDSPTSHPAAGSSVAAAGAAAARSGSVAPVVTASRAGAGAASTCPAWYAADTGTRSLFACFLFCFLYAKPRLFIKRGAAQYFFTRF